MRYAVIMAGGAGQRLWPLSRRQRPKQLLPLLEGKDLLTIAVERLVRVFPAENILVITGAEHVDVIRQALPNLLPENVVGEPIGRDTANAIALGAEILAAKDEQAVMAVFTADHVIRPADEFSRAVLQACTAAEAHPDALLTFGVRPTWPHTGLGYIHCGGKLDEDLHEVIAFREKPEHSTARRYVESGRHFWNSGMFVWTVGAIRSALKEFLPESMNLLAPIAPAAAKGQDLTPLLQVIYPKLQKISIDYAVMEKAHRVMMVELHCEWLDVGSWPALENVCDLDEAGNAVVAENVAIVDSFRNVIVTEDDHLLAVLGMDNCIIVHSKDATLVCNKNDSQRLKELVAMLGEKFSERFL